MLCGIQDPSSPTIIYWLLKFRLFIAHGCCCCCYLVRKSCLTFVTPWTAACQPPPSTGFSQQEYWSGLPFPSPHTWLIFFTVGFVFGKCERLTVCSTNLLQCFWQFSGHTRLLSASVLLFMVSSRVFSNLFTCYSFLHLRPFPPRSHSLTYILYLSCFLIGGKLLYNVVLISAIQQHNYTYNQPLLYISPLSWASLLSPLKYILLKFLYLWFARRKISSCAWKHLYTKDNFAVCSTLGWQFSLSTLKLWFHWLLDFSFVFVKSAAKLLLFGSNLLFFPSGCFHFFGVMKFYSDVPLGAFYLPAQDSLWFMN